MAATARGTSEVVFVLLPEVILLDVAGPADAFRNAGNRVPGSYRLRVTAPQPALAAAEGLQLSGLEPLPARLEAGTILVLTGVSGASIDVRAPATRGVIDWLRESARPELLLCVCAGSVLAQPVDHAARRRHRRARAGAADTGEHEDRTGLEPCG